MSTLKVKKCAVCNVPMLGCHHKRKYCKRCKPIQLTRYWKEYNEKHPGRNAKIGREWREKNRERSRQYAKDYYAKKRLLASSGGSRCTP